MAEFIVRYNYRLRPGVKAERYLMDEWHRCRWIWNQCVAMRKAGQRPESRMLTAWRKAYPWLGAGSAVAHNQTLRTLVFTKRPAFKSRHKTRPSLQYKGDAFRLKDGALRLRRGITIPVVWSRELPSAPKTVRVFQNAAGHWFASFVVRVQLEPLAPSGAAVGIDWGVTATATADRAEYDLPHAQHGQRSAQRLARYQRMMARRKPKPGRRSSKGYKQAKRLTAKLHAQTAARRLEGTRAWARKVVADHGYLAVEDFKPKFLSQSTLAKKAADGAIGQAKRELLNYAARAGRTVALVPPAYTTMTCGKCFARAKHRFPLSERTFRCDNCGHEADRDRNAARVILATAGFDRADVETVRRQSTQVVEDAQVESGSSS